MAGLGQAASFTLCFVLLLQGDELDSLVSAVSPCAVSAQGWLQVSQAPLTCISDTLALTQGHHTDRWRRQL